MAVELYYRAQWYENLNLLGCVNCIMDDSFKAYVFVFAPFVYGWYPLGVLLICLLITYCKKFKKT